MQKLIFSSLIIVGFIQTQPSQASSTDEAKTVTLDAMEVKGRATDLLGIAASASQGVVGQREFAYRPLARAGELVEAVPGALATQHSGSGKANQFYLRGFNLDHGTDFSVMVDGVPMNMPSHAHGQGYLDLNSVIPELVDNIEYGKGPYYADAGDFSSAGYSRMHTMRSLPKGLFKFTGGEFGYYRALLADSKKIGAGDLLAAGEFNAYNGVWQQPEDLGKYNGMLRYTLDNKDWGLSVNAKAYHSSWNATNQIPERAIDSGTLDLYGSMDLPMAATAVVTACRATFGAEATATKTTLMPILLITTSIFIPTLPVFLTTPSKAIKCIKPSAAWSPAATANKPGLPNGSAWTSTTV
jgi:TonB-dependent Receptor Plug Domain.